MKLSEWMKEQELNQEQVAELMGVDQTTISRIVNGRSCKDATKIVIIEKTDGKVTANDLLGLTAD